MKQHFFIIIMLAVFFNSYTQYLDPQINAVVELKKEEYTIASLNNTLLTVSYRVKILNQKGEKYSNIRIYVNSLSQLIRFKGNIYDSSGKRIQKISKSKLHTISYVDNFSLYSDSKIIKAEFHHTQYPFYIEYTYTIKYNSFLGCYWHVMDDYDLPCEEAELIVNVPRTIDINFRESNFNGSFDTTSLDEIKIYKWKAENSAAVSKESYSKGFMDMFPSILVSPNQFNYAGYSGRNDSWENYGKWILDLLQDRDALPEETISMIHQLTDPVSDTIAKIKLLYKYLQSNTRYVSIQKGIGGFQPMTATSVDQCRYGDCKALSNYLKSMLSVIGVEGYYTEIGNGEGRRIKWADFPSVYQTNHAILTVPFNKDTIWLECTSNTSPFGYIGSGNSNRNAVIITDSGGKIVNTPKYGLEENAQITKANIVLNENGSMQCKATFRKSGILMDDMIYLKYYDNRLQEKIIREKFPSINLESIDFNIYETEDLFPKMIFDVNISENSFLSKTGNFYSFKPNYLNRLEHSLRIGDQRKNEIYFQNGYIKSDTIKFELPENLKVELLPENNYLESLFGKYSTEFYGGNHELIYIRMFIFNEGNFPKEKFEELVRFFNSVRTSDNQTVILKNEL